MSEYKLLRFERNLSERFTVYEDITGKKYKLDHLPAKVFYTEEEMLIFVNNKLEERKRYMKLKNSLTNKELSVLFPDNKYLSLTPQKMKSYKVEDVVTLTLVDDWGDCEDKFNSWGDLEFHVRDLYDLVYTPNIDFIKEKIDE